jgi:hypothetical protein
MPGHKQYAGQAVWAGLVAFKDGKTFAAEYQTNLITQESKTFMAEFINGEPDGRIDEKEKKR